MSKRSRESQVKTIQQIQSQIKTYICWKECGTVAKYFKKSDLINHIYSLRLIFTLTIEGKIASKASKLDHVFRIILKKEYDETPNCAALPYLRLKDGNSTVPKNSRLSSKQYHPTSSHRQKDPQKMGKLLQTVPPSKSSSLPKNEVVTPYQGDKKRRNCTSNLSL